MSDFMKRLRDSALENQKRREEARETTDHEALLDAEREKNRQAAEFLGMDENVVANCCGSICPHCEMFLDKAIALEELGHSHHLFMNPSQEEVFNEALRIYREDRHEYERRRGELMDRMR